MYDPKVLAVIIGVIGALLGVYLKEALRKAHARLFSASRLEAYLRYWLSLALENKVLFSIIAAGYTFSEKEKTALLSGNVEKIEKVRKDLADRLDKLLEELKKQPDIATDLIKKIKRFQKDEIEVIFWEIDRFLESFDNGTAFVTTEEAGQLSWFIQPHIVQVRSDLISIFVDIKYLITHIYSNDKPDQERVNEQVSACLNSGIKAAKHLMPLLEYAQRVRAKGVIGNLF